VCVLLFVFTDRYADTDTDADADTDINNSDHQRECARGGVRRGGGNGKKGGRGRQAVIGSKKQVRRGPGRPQHPDRPQHLPVSSGWTYDARVSSVKLLIRVSSST
jgi:hypothetical protein